MNFNDWFYKNYDDLASNFNLEEIAEKAWEPSRETDAWIKCSDRLPEKGDYNVLVYFSKLDSIDMVHVEDYFDDITAGLDENGNQLYTKMYLSNDVTHWTPLPEPPHDLD